MEKNHLVVGLCVHPVDGFFNFLFGTHSGGEKNRLLFPSDMFNQGTMGDITRCDLERADSEFIEKVRALLVKWSGEEIDVQAARLLIQRSECVIGKFQFPEQLLKIGLVLCMCQCRGSC